MNSVKEGVAMGAGLVLGGILTGIAITAARKALSK